MEKEIEKETEDKNRQTEINIFSNATILSQALTNIIKNSIVYNKPNGTVEITTAQNKNKTIITIVDTGIGMTDDQLKRLFQPFSQADSSITRNYGGTGLGLSLVKHIVDRHRGHLEIRSIVGKGTTVSILLPVAPTGPS